MTRLSGSLLAAYAAPALPLAALLLPLHVHLAPFYAARGVDLAALGAVLIAVRLLDAATDPLMGWLSDRLSPPFGRRRFWLLASLPVLGLSVPLLLGPPEGAGLLWFASFSVLVTLGWTMASVPYTALGAEITGDYAGRARVTVWRESAGLLGTVAALVVVDGLGLGALGIAIALALPVAVLLLLALVPEPRPGPPLRVGLAAMAGTLVRDRVFLRLLLAFLVNGAANGLPPALFLFYATHVLRAEAGMAGLLLLLYFAAAVAGGTLWSRAVRRVAKHRVWCLAMMAAGAAFLPAAFLGPGDLLPFALVCLVSGLLFGADLALPPAIQADVVDRETARSGQVATGSFFALWALAAKAALALSGGLAFLALDAAGFRAEGGNGQAALATLAWLYAGAPVALKLLAVAIMWGFPLDRAAQERVRAEIAARGLSP